MLRQKTMSEDTDYRGVLDDVVAEAGGDLPETDNSSRNTK